MFMSRAKIALFIVVATSLWSGKVLAGVSTFTLHRASLINVTDSAGTTQREAGTVQRGGVTIGNYYIARRVDTLAGALFNSYPAHVALLFAPKAGTTPVTENITMDGTHDFTSGDFKGSVSATSSAYSWVRDADADYTPTGAVGVATLVIRWTGSGQLVIP